MYTGIVEGTGVVRQIDAKENGKQICVAPRFDFSDLKMGDSIAVNGACLTITQMDTQQFYADIVQETLDKTNLSDLTVDAQVNLERCAKIGDRIGGHFVKGHVDCTGTISDIKQQGIAIWLTIRFPELLKPYLIAKGSITIDGMSITVVEAGQDHFTVTLIPHTQASTIAQYYQLGTIVNLEADIIAKYLVSVILDKTYSIKGLGSLTANIGASK